MRFSIQLPQGRDAVRTGRRGGVAVEFGLLMPFVMAVFCGIFDFGWGFYQHDTLNRVVRTGCRAGALADSDLRVQVAEEAMEKALVDAHYSCPVGGCDVDAEILGDTSTAGVGHDEMIACSVSAPMQPLTGAIPGLDGITLKAATRLRVEWSPR